MLRLKHKFIKFGSSHASLSHRVVTPPSVNVSPSLTFSHQLLSSVYGINGYPISMASLYSVTQSSFTSMSSISYPRFEALDTTFPN